MKLKLRTRIVGGLFCIFLLAIVLGVFSFFTIRRVQDMSWELDELVALDASINEVLEDLHIWRYELVAAIVFQEEFNNSLFAEESAYGVWRASPNPEWIADDEIAYIVGLLDITNENMHAATRELMHLIEAHRQGMVNLAFLSWDLQARVLPYAAESIAHLQALSARYRTLVQEQSDSVWFFQNNAGVIILLVSIGAVVLFIILSYVILRAILTPIRRIGKSASEVALGNFNINRHNYPDDEIGNLASDVYALIDVIQALINDFVKLHQEVETNGSISYRIDSAHYSGAFKEFCEHGNDLVKGFSNDLSLVFSVLEAIEEGDFDAKFRQLPGEKGVINQHFNSIMGSLKHIHGEITRLFQNVTEGVLDDEADVTMYKGSWRQLIEEMNHLLASVADPLSEIEIALAEMAKGNFNTPVTGQYKGAFEALKQTVNSTGNDLIKNVTEITQILQGLAAGDLAVPINRENIDSYSPIKHALIDIFRSLNESLWSIQSIASQVQDGAEQMSNNASSLAEGTSRQAEAIRALDESLESINEKTRLSAETASAASQRSQQSTDSAQNGSRDMQTTMAAIQGIKSSSDNITKIIGLIQDISFQTNLLALNASVEAARAGEHGRGFSVVAEEVRNLATRSQAATQETSSEIEESMRKVAEGMSVAKSTADSLNMIVNHVNEVSELITQIANMAQEQAIAIDNVYKGVSDISQVVQSNSAASEECAAASEELSAQAETLKQAIQFFKVRPPRKAH